jgi:hypothetical protein
MDQFFVELSVTLIGENSFCSLRYFHCLMNIHLDQSPCAGGHLINPETITASP